MAPSDFADFDRYVDEYPELEDDLPAAFGQWLADASGQAIVGGPVDGPPEFVAVPDEQ